jgi:hypothetical protein
MSEKRKSHLDVEELQAEAFVVEELEPVAGGITPGETRDVNCGTCTCECRLAP